MVAGSNLSHYMGIYCDYCKTCEGKKVNYFLKIGNASFLLIY